MISLFHDNLCHYSWYEWYELEANGDTSGVTGVYCKTDKTRLRGGHIRKPVYRKQSPEMFLQMSLIGNWIVTTDIKGIDIILEQESNYQDSNIVGIRWKKTIPDLHVYVTAGKDYKTCTDTRTENMITDKVYVEDKRTTEKPACIEDTCGRSSVQSDVSTRMQTPDYLAFISG